MMSLFEAVKIKIPWSKTGMAWGSQRENYSWVRLGPSLRSGGTLTAINNTKLQLTINTSESSLPLRWRKCGALPHWWRNLLSYLLGRSRLTCIQGTVANLFMSWSCCICLLRRRIYKRSHVDQTEPDEVCMSQFFPSQMSKVFSPMTGADTEHKEETSCVEYSVQSLETQISWQRS